MVMLDISMRLCAYAVSYGYVSMYDVMGYVCMGVWVMVGAVMMLWLVMSVSADGLWVVMLISALVRVRPSRARVWVQLVYQLSYGAG